MSRSLFAVSVVVGVLLSLPCVVSAWNCIGIAILDGISRLVVLLWGVLRKMARMQGMGLKVSLVFVLGESGWYSCRAAVGGMDGSRSRDVISVAIIVWDKLVAVQVRGADFGDILTFCFCIAKFGQVDDTIALQ